MLYVSFGVEKGGSTYTYCLIQAALEAAGHSHIQLEKSGRRATRLHRKPINNINHWDERVLAAADEAVPHDRIVALRTHAEPHPAVLEAIDAGRVQLGLAVRDPRDLALSVLDVATRRTSLPTKEKWAPIDPGNLESAFPAVDRTVRQALQWMGPKATVFHYEASAFQPCTSLGRLSDQLGLRRFSDEECAAIARSASGKPYTKRNVAAPLRHVREMNAADQRRVLNRFAEFYDVFFPDAEVMTAD